MLLGKLNPIETGKHSVSRIHSYVFRSRYEVILKFRENWDKPGDHYGRTAEKLCLSMMTTLLCYNFTSIERISTKISTIACY